MDVFEPLAAKYPLEAIETLDELAELVFSDRTPRGGRSR